MVPRKDSTFRISVEVSFWFKLITKEQFSLRGKKKNPVEKAIKIQNGPRDRINETDQLFKDPVSTVSWKDRRIDAIAFSLLNTVNSTLNSGIVVRSLD